MGLSPMARRSSAAYMHTVSNNNNNNNRNINVPMGRLPRGRCPLPRGCRPPSHNRTGTKSTIQQNRSLIVHPTACLTVNSAVYSSRIDADRRLRTGLPETTKNGAHETMHGKQRKNLKRELIAANKSLSWLWIADVTLTFTKTLMVCSVFPFKTAVPNTETVAFALSECVVLFSREKSKHSILTCKESISSRF